MAARKLNRAPHRRPDVTDELVRRYGYFDGLLPRLGDPPTTADVRPMGPLVEMHVDTLKGRREVWRFDPMPRLVFNRRSKRMWVMGQGFRFDGNGFHPTGGAPRRLSVLPLAREMRAPDLAAQLREFNRTHYGVKPDEAVVGFIAYPDALTPLGYLENIVYKTDRNDGDGKSEWIHRYEDENLPGVKVHKRPIVCTNTTGTGIWFCGGTYSVIDGWLGG